MKRNKYFSVTALTAVLFLALAVCRIVVTFVPMAVIPKLDIPAMVLLCLVALLLSHYLAPEARRCNVLQLLLAGVAFGVLPYVAGFADPMGAVKLAVVGGIVFMACAWLFAEVQERLSTGPAAKAAPIFSALGLYLAAQCFSGILL